MAPHVRKTVLVMAARADVRSAGDGGVGTRVADEGEKPISLLDLKQATCWGW